MTELESWQVLIGAVFILMYSYGRFNTPPTNRSSTTAFRYHLGASVYTFTILALYSLIVYVPDLAKAIGSQEKDLPLVVRELTNPLLVALFLTVLLPNSPWLSEIDNLLRKKTQAMAAIPYEVRRLSQELQRLPVVFSDELRRQTRDELSHHFHPADVLFESCEAPQYTWTRVTAMMTQLRSWQADARFNAFLVRFSDDWQEIRREYTRLTPQAAKSFKLARAISDDELVDARSAAMVSDYLANVHSQAQKLVERLHDFVAHATLDCDFTPAARKQRLTRLGIQVDEGGPRPDHNMLVGVFLLLFLATATGLSLARTFPPRQFLLLAASISLVHLLAVLVSLTLKRRRRHARVRGWWHRPWAAYACAGLAAVGAAFPLSLARRVLDTLNEHSWSGGAAFFLTLGENFYEKAPWLLMAFTTAFVLSYHLDNESAVPLAGNPLRMFETASQAGLTLIASLFVVRLLPDAPPGLLPMIVSSTIGLLIGFIVPTAYRSANRQEAIVASGPLPANALPAGS